MSFNSFSTFSNLEKSPNTNCITGYGSNWKQTDTDIVTDTRSFYGQPVISFSGQYVACCRAYFGIYVSNDFGSTWTITPNTTSQYNFTGMSPSGKIIFVWGTDRINYHVVDNVFYPVNVGAYSLDYGVTFLQDNSFLNFFNSSVNDQYIFCTDTNYFLKYSNDFGVTFYTPSFFESKPVIYGQCSSDNRIQIVTGNFFNFSTDYGTTWTEILLDENESNLIFQMSQDAKYIILNSSSHYYFGTFSGENYQFTIIDTDFDPVDNGALLMSSSGQYSAFASSYAIAYSSDYGKSFNNLPIILEKDNYLSASITISNDGNYLAYTTINRVTDGLGGYTYESDDHGISFNLKLTQNQSANDSQFDIYAQQIAISYDGKHQVQSNRGFTSSIYMSHGLP